MAPKKGKQKEQNVQDVEKEAPKPLKPTLDNLPFLESLLAQAKEVPTVPLACSYPPNQDQGRVSVCPPPPTPSSAV